MKNILIGILLLLSGIVFGQTSTSPGNQTFFLSSIADTNTLIGVRGRDALFVSSTNKFYKRTSYWALQATISTGSGTVSSVSVVSANGLAGTVATATTTPAITLSTSISGILKGNGTAISAATPSTDYTIPADLSVYLTSATAASTYMPLVGAAFTTTTGIGHELTSSTLTSGSLFKLTGTSTANLTGAKMFEISSSGTNSNSSVTKYGVYSSVTNTGTSSTNIAGYFSASGGTSNIAATFLSGTNKEIRLGSTAGGYTSSSYFTDLTSLMNTINLTRADGVFTEALFNYGTGDGLSNLGLAARGKIKLNVGGVADRGLQIRETGLSNFSNFLGITTGTTVPLAPLHIGPNLNVAVANDPAILISRDISDATGTGSGHGVVDEPAIFRTVAGIGYASFDSRIVISGTTNYDHALAVQSGLTYGSSGTLTNAYGMFHTLIANSGTVTNSYGARFNNATGVGTITNQYGVYIENQTRGSVLNYGIYAAGGLNYFGGNIIQTATVSTGTGATAGTQLNYNSLTTGNGIDASTSSLTTGMLQLLTSTSTALSGSTSCVSKIMSSGANSNASATATGQLISVTNTGTGSTNVGATFDVSGATNNYAIQAMAGATRGIFRTSLTSNGDGLVVGDWTGNGNGSYIRFLRPSGGTIASTFSQGNADLIFSTNLSGFTFQPGSTTTDGIALSYNTNTTSNMFKITGAGTALSGTTPTGLNIAISGANSNTAVTATGINVAVSNTNATSGTNIAATFSASGATTNNIALNITAGRQLIAVAPVASANYGTLSIGSGAFDGSTTGFFTGSANGTHIAVNAASGSTGDLMNLQVAGVDRYRFDKTGILYISGASSYTTALQVQQVSSGISYIYNTITSANSILNFGTKNAQRLSIDAEGQSAFTPATHAPSSGSTAFYDVSITGTHAATNAASGAYKPLNITYTINNTGTASTATATGIFLNATETALNSMTHNLMDLQVGGVSKIRITNNGQIFNTSNNSFTGGVLTLGSGTVITLGSRSLIQSVSDGTLLLTNNGASDFNRLQFGGITSSFPAIARDAANLRIVDASNGNASGLGIGESLPASAKLSVASTTQGALMPRMTTAQKNAISSPAEGLIVYDTDLHKLYVYDGSTWQAAW